MREVITWELAQKYFIDPTFFGGALVPGQSNVFTTTVDFTGIAFLNELRQAVAPHLPPEISMPTSRTEAEWDLDYDFKNSRINASTVFVNYRFRRLHRWQRRQPSCKRRLLSFLPPRLGRSTSFASCWAMDIPPSAASAGPRTLDSTPILCFCNMLPCRPPTTGIAAVSAWNTAASPWDRCAMRTSSASILRWPISARFGNLRRQEKLF